VPGIAPSRHDGGVQNTLGKNDAPAAVRAQPPGWRDPRLWVGVAIVAVSVVAGARIVGASDDTIAVWSVVDDLAPGDLVEPGDLEQARVRFAEPSDADRYLRVDDELPSGPVLTRGVGSGELLPRAALGTADDAGTVSLSVSVPGAQVPTSVGAGSRVDVWIMPDSGGGGGDERAAELAVEDVAVIDSPAGSSDFGSASSERQLVLGIPRETDLSDLVLASGAGRVMLVGRG
jgi:hypothetical protein